PGQVVEYLPQKDLFGVQGEEPRLGRQPGGPISSGLCAPGSHGMEAEDGQEREQETGPDDASGHHGFSTTAERGTTSGIIRSRSVGLQDETRVGRAGKSL